jgi:hypothetical protein
MALFEERLTEARRTLLASAQEGRVMVMGRRMVFVLVALITVSWESTGFGQVATTVDPAALVGEWRGTWTAGAVTGGPGPRSGRQGPFVLTIAKVEGNVASGTVEMEGVTSQIRATLRGNQLTFGNEQFQTELTIEGNHMRGTRQRAGTPRTVLDLEKRK